MPDFTINVPKDWGETQKDLLAKKLKKARIFTAEDTVFITNKITIHKVNTETYDMLVEMKEKLDS